ncbi:MAG: hypothetical protein WCG55_01475 [bacterium]
MKSLIAFWKNSENNGVKILVVVGACILAGFFVYKSMHTDALQNTGSVGVSPAATSAVGYGTGTGTTVAGSTWTCPTTPTASSGTLVVTADSTFLSGNVTHGSTGTLGQFVVSNPTACPVALLRMQFGLNDTTPTDVYKVAVFSGTSMFGNPILVVPTSTGIPNHPLIYTATTSSGLLVPAGGSVTLSVQSSIAMTAVIGDSLTVQLYKLAGRDLTGTAPYLWTAGTMSPVISSLMTII